MVLDNVPEKLFSCYVFVTHIVLLLLIFLENKIQLLLLSLERIIYLF